jgi:hypothetical protein
LHHASDYFDQLYTMAEYLINEGYAYVDSQSAEQMAANRGNFNTPGVNSPFRNRPREESLQMFRDMKAGKYKDGEHILRAKISEDAMSSPNMNMRDPAIYRIRHEHHVRTGDAWCIYPCTTTRIRFPMRWKTSRIPFAPLNSRTTARSTTGCWKPCRKAASSSCRCRNNMNSRA